MTDPSVPPIDPATGARVDLELCGFDRPVEQLPFEAIVEALETLAARLANGELGIEAAVELYEQAELLHEVARQRLAAVQSRIERLAPPP